MRLCDKAVSDITKHNKQDKHLKYCEAEMSHKNKNKLAHHETFYNLSAYS